MNEWITVKGGTKRLNDLSYSSCNEMLFLEHKNCQEDVLRLRGKRSYEDPYLRYLLIWLPVTEKQLNLLFPKLAMTAVSGGREGSKPLQLPVLCARAAGCWRRDGGWFALLCCRRSCREEKDSPLHWQFLDFCSAISYDFRKGLSWETSPGKASKWALELKKKKIERCD